MRLIVVADIHANFDELSTLLSNLKIKSSDVLVVAGDLTDFRTQRAIEKGKMIVESLSKLDQVVVVPGNCDPPEIRELIVTKGLSVHSKAAKFGDIGFFGFGGAKTPFNTLFEPEEKEIKEGLEKGFKKIKNCKKRVMITHAPPIDTKLDLTSSRDHVGSKAVRKAIEKSKPDLTICAHIHESTGEDKIGKTTIFYPGPLAEGNFGIVKINKDIKTETGITLDLLESPERLEDIIKDITKPEE